MKPLIYSGGMVDTNAFLFPNNDGTYLCCDAPEGVAAFIESRGIKIGAVLLTHGHFDHVWDAGVLAQAHGCEVWAHGLDFAMIQNPGYLRSFGIARSYQPPEQLREFVLDAKGVGGWSGHGHEITLFHVPGHCPGSVAFYWQQHGLVVGGDVLFAGGIGRYDFPNCSRHELLASIQKHLMPLPDATVLYPGHGEATTIGRERVSNPYLVSF